MRHYAGVTSNPSTVPAALELDAVLRYEMARLGLWQAICKRNPQLALFSEVYGDSPNESMGWSYSTSDRTGEPVRLAEPTKARGWGRTMLDRTGLTAIVPGRVAPPPSPPGEGGASAPNHTTSKETP